MAQAQKQKPYCYLMTKPLNNGKEAKYVGSSTLPMEERKWRHLSDLRLGKKSIAWKGLDDQDWKIEKIYEFDYGTNAIEIHKKEEEFRILHNACLNIRKCVQKRYPKCRLEEMKKNNCECGGKFTKVNKKIHEQTAKHQKYLKTKTVLEKSPVKV